MPTSGSGVGTPISFAGGSGSAPDADPLVRTHLPIARYAKILGISPVHFQGATGIDVWPFHNHCSNIWPRYSWQHGDQVAHEDLALAIKHAEDEIAAFLGYQPAPTWFSSEPVVYTKFYEPASITTGMFDTRSYNRAVISKWKKVISAGRRATTLIDQPSTTGGELVYSDEDGDGFAETATITVTTTVTDECELKVYFTGTSADPRWEIRPHKSISISGGVATIVFHSWMLIDPDLQAAHPDTAGFSAINAEDTNSYVSQVDVYREYNDTTAVSSVLMWENSANQISICTACNGTGCIECSYTSQNGCLLVRDPETGLVAPSIATYNSTDGVWYSASPTINRTPDRARIWYLAGDMDDDYVAGNRCDPLSDFMARNIAVLATARLERPFCQCGNVTALADHWREELTFQGRDGAHLFDFDLLDNPFGTTRGELMVYKALSMFGKRKISVGVVG